MHLNLNGDLLFHCPVSNQQGKLEKNQDKVSKSIFRRTFVHLIVSFWTWSKTAHKRHL